MSSCIFYEPELPEADTGSQSEDIVMEIMIISAMTFGYLVLELNRPTFKLSFSCTFNTLSCQNSSILNLIT